VHGAAPSEQVPGMLADPTCTLWWLRAPRTTVITVSTAAALAGAVLFIAAGLAWTARLVHIGNLDALALAEKLDVPYPTSLVDWPELRVRSAVSEPDEPLLVLLLVEWPARERLATALIALQADNGEAMRQLTQWRDEDAAISPARRDGDVIVLRRRRTLDRVTGRLIAEDAAVVDVPSRTAPGTSHLGRGDLA
jgi:hypothetical protein